MPPVMTKLSMMAQDPDAESASHNADEPSAEAFNEAGAMFRILVRRGVPISSVFELLLPRPGMRQHHLPPPAASLVPEEVGAQPAGWASTMVQADDDAGLHQPKIPGAAPVAAERRATSSFRRPHHTDEAGLFVMAQWSSSARARNYRSSLRATP